MARVVVEPGPSVPRVIAVVLALGGSMWGLWLLLIFRGAALISLPLAAGYLVTAGYIVRAVSKPAFGVRRAIWVASLLVQGWWLLSFGIPVLRDTGPSVPFWWWAFATAASGVALATERRSVAEPDRPRGKLGTTAFSGS